MAAFPEVPKIKFEGPQSKNPLAFRYYEEGRPVAGKTMKDHLRFSVAYWHTMRGTGSDPFGPGTMLRPWEGAEDSVDNAIHRVRVAFEFMEKLGAPFFCFHDRDIAPEGRSLAETDKNLDAVVKIIKQEMARTGSSCCGVRPTSSAIPATCTAPPPAPTPTPSPSPPPR